MRCFVLVLGHEVSLGAAQGKNKLFPGINCTIMSFRRRGLRDLV